ncbi:hypothetical protein AB834_03475 [PVC group bacterium (ex Bugula neritina AB1)]|nr:hypothetical protein AB834_03475 [PVC group bacterium (ex Bugula neritina AB1)]
MEKTYTCRNGLRVLVTEMPHMYSASVGLWVKVGGRHENRFQKGLSHFLEHMVFKGTKTRTCQEIAETIEGVGGYLNACTSKEYTCFYAKTLDKDYFKAIDILTDMAFHPLFNLDDIQKEKDVVLEEIKMYMDSPSQLIHDYLDEVLWGSDHPMGFWLTGKEDDVRSFNKDDCHAFLKEHYFAKNIVISVAGKVKAQDTFDFIEGLDIGSSDNEYVPPRSFAMQRENFVIKWIKKDIEQTQMAMAFYSYAKDHPLRYAAEILGIFLGGNMSSYLYKELREKRGIVYDIRASSETYSDVGVFEISAGLDADKVLEMLKIISEKLEDLKVSLIQEEELERAKAYFKGRVLFSMERPDSRMSFSGERLLIMGKTVAVEDILKKIDEVSLKDIQVVASEIFLKGHFSAVGIGSKDMSEDIKGFMDAV